ncbi:MAG: signal peptidase I [Clostridia bacterium]|nr:signal peptidase I [Clostridia bacterium]
MKILKLIKNIISGILIALLALILFVNIYSIIQRQSSGRNHPNILGYANAIVISGSMSPEIEIDDLVVTKKQAEYHVGDIVTVDNGKSFVTHRIIEETPEGFITKGDANNSPDAFVATNENISGKVIKVFSGGGKYVAILQSPLGMMCMVLLAFVLLCLPAGKKKENKEEN